jgi:predicted  nucleic acid-binding Zn-ribbon protein
VAVWAAAAAAGDQLGNKLIELDDRKRDLKREREQVSKDLRNSQKRRDRLLEKARGLTDADLLDILAQRAQAKAKAAAAKAKPKAKPKAKAQAKAAGAAPDAAGGGGGAADEDDAE